MASAPFDTAAIKASIFPAGHNNSLINITIPIHYIII
jgi:hypothetical protein